MQEIIAVTKKNLAAFYFVCALFVAGIVVSGCYRVYGSFIFYLILVLGGATFFVPVYVAVRVLVQPRLLITYESGKLHFADGLECTPDELESVNYTRATTRVRPSAVKWGTLIVRCNGEHRYPYVADVIAAHDRIVQLMRKDTDCD